MWESPNFFGKPITIPASRIKQLFVTQTTDRQDNALEQLVLHTAERVQELELQKGIRDKPVGGESTS